MNGVNPLDSASPFFASVAAARTAETQEQKRSSAGKKEAAGRKTFRDVLAGAETEQTAAADGLSGEKQVPGEQTLRALLDEVTAAGETLKANPVPDTITAYRKAVQAFVRYVVHNSYDVTEHTSGRNVLKRKKFTQLEVIDQKLDQLAAGILFNQKDQIHMLARVEEINGLLIDMLT